MINDKSTDDAAQIILQSIIIAGRTGGFSAEIEIDEGRQHHKIGKFAQHFSKLISSKIFTLQKSRYLETLKPTNHKITEFEDFQPQKIQIEVYLENYTIGNLNTIHFPAKSIQDFHPPEIWE